MDVSPPRPLPAELCASWSSALHEPTAGDWSGGLALMACQRLARASLPSPSPSSSDGAFPVPDGRSLWSEVYAQLVAAHPRASWPGRCSPRLLPAPELAALLDQLGAGPLPWDGPAPLLIAQAADLARSLAQRRAAQLERALALLDDLLLSVQEDVQKGCSEEHVRSKYLEPLGLASLAGSTRKRARSGDEQPSEPLHKKQQQDEQPAQVLPESEEEEKKDVIKEEQEDRMEVDEETVVEQELDQEREKELEEVQQIKPPLNSPRAGVRSSPRKRPAPAPSSAPREDGEPPPLPLEEEHEREKKEEQEDEQEQTEETSSTRRRRGRKTTAERRTRASRGGVETSSPSPARATRASRRPRRSTS